MRIGGKKQMLLAIVTVLAALLGALICVGAGGGILAFILGFVGGFLGLAVLAFGFFFVMCQVINPKKPQEKDSRFYRNMTHLYVDAIITIARVKIKQQGMDKVPENGRFLLVSNHRDNIDPAFLLTCFRKKQLAFISKREVQEMFLVGKLMHKLLCQPINRENDREALKTILKCVRILEEDKASVAVFPEGYIYDDRKLHHFRPGVFKIATKTKVPIVVCTLRGTHEALPKAMRLKRSEVEVRLLQVIYPEEYENMTTVELSEQIYARMAADLGPELVSEGE
jgi:1-acyl-sn-glycerol-3-phosphate acyltransferase